MSFRSDTRPPSINTECSGTSSRTSSFGSGETTPMDLVTPRDTGNARLNFGDILMSPKKKIFGHGGSMYGHRDSFSLQSPLGLHEHTPDDAACAVKSAAKTLLMSPSSSRKRPPSLQVNDVSGTMHSGKKGSLQQLDSTDDDSSREDDLGTPCQLFSSADCDSPAVTDAAIFCNEDCLHDDDVPSRGSIGGRKLLAENSLTRTMSSNFGFCDHFYWLKKLGSGSFSHVWLCEHKHTGEFFAVKADQRPLKGLRDRELHLREIGAVKEIGRHDYVVQYFRSWQEDRYFFSQMEFCEYGCLQQLCAKGALSLGCGGRDWPVIGRIVHDTVSGLAAIHSHNLLHLDIKPGVCPLLPHPALNALSNNSAISRSSVQATFSFVPPANSKSAISGCACARHPGTTRRVTASTSRASF
jgi:hypothetical protein